MRVTRIMWYAGTMLTALAMLAASATTTGPDQAPTLHERDSQTYLPAVRLDPVLGALGPLLRH